jgi:hypothetical protein
MSQVTVTAAGVVIVLNLPSGPLPTIDPHTGQTWAGNSVGGYAGTTPQPGTYDKTLTNPAGN